MPKVHGQVSEGAGLRERQGGLGPVPFTAVPSRRGTHIQAHKRRRCNSLTINENLSHERCPSRLPDGPGGVRQAARPGCGDAGPPRAALLPVHSLASTDHNSAAAPHEKRTSLLPGESTSRTIPGRPMHMWQR